jgi:sec-independent protein translocase protein TatA
MFGLGVPELLIVLGLFVLLFGGAKLPSLMRNMGRSVNEFKTGMSEMPEPRKVDSSDDKTDEECKEAPPSNKIG